MDEDERPISNTDLSDDFKNATEIDESSSNLSSNVLDRRKILILASGEHLPDPINVVYECHICYDTFDSISLSEEHLTKFHASEAKDDDSIVNDSSVADQHIQDVNDNDETEFRYGTEATILTDDIEVDETLTTLHGDDNDDEGIAEKILSNENLTMTEETFVPVIVVAENEATKPELKFNCQKCGGKFAKEKSLNIHIKLNKCTIKSFECQICQKVFVRKKNLDCHMQTHNEPSEFPCKFPNCSEVFNQADTLAVHIQTQHEPSRKYLCPYCWKGID